jgi:predicted dehydrogenase
MTAHVSRFAVVGLGTRSAVARFLAEQGLPGRVVALCEPSRARQAWGIARYPHARLFAGVEEMLGSGITLDGAFVMTPDDTHEALTIRFLQAGIAVFVEKPLAISTVGCDRVLEAARRTRTPLYVGHNMRHLPVMHVMRRLIKDGAIGDVKAVWCRHFVGHGGDYYFKDWHADRRRSNGLLLQKGAHDIDAIHWLAGGYTIRTHALGALAVYGAIEARGGQGTKRLAQWNDPERNWPPESLTGLNDVVDVEDISMMGMELDNGVLATYEQCHFTPDYWRNYTVIGTHGRLENFGDVDGASVKVWNARRSGYRSDADIEINVPARSGGHGGADAPLVSEFVRFVRDGALTLTSPVSARHAVAAGCAATESLRQHGIPIDIAPLPLDVVDYFASKTTVD